MTSEISTVPPDSEREMNAYDRDIIGDSRVQYRLPLRSVSQVRAALVELREAVDDSLDLLNQVQPSRRSSDRHLLLAVRGIIRSTNDAANASKST